MIRSVDDLEKIPILTKREAIRNYKDIVNTSLVRDVNLSGGSKGLRLQYAYSDHWMHLFRRTLWRGFGWAGFSRDQKVVTFYSRN